ncbi:hypothetical protein [Flavicella sp.]|uniref:hypothetical protein n=1 Tax=Flavicella sp. TaxID=2957742 RepID=UPI00301A76E2
MDESVENLLMYESGKLNTTVIWLLFLFFGWSYGSMDKVGTQILFYITFGGAGIWAIVRLFTLNGAIKDYNRKKGILANLSNKQMIALGLV